MHAILKDISAELVNIRVRNATLLEHAHYFLITATPDPKRALLLGDRPAQPQPQLVDGILRGVVVGRRRRGPVQAGEGARLLLAEIVRRLLELHFLLRPAGRGLRKLLAVPPTAAAAAAAAGGSPRSAPKRRWRRLFQQQRVALATPPPAVQQLQSSSCGELLVHVTIQ